MARGPIKVRALTLELVIVVAGVLIALAADSWWDARDDDQRTDAYLMALEADFSMAQRELDVAIDGYSRVLTLTTEFLTYVQAAERPDGPAPDPWAVDDVRFFPPFGTIDALLTTGDIALLPESVRTVLIRERAALDNRLEQSRRFLDLWAASVRDIFLPSEEARFGGATGPSSIAEVARQSPQARTGWLQLRVAVGNVLAEHRAMKSSVDAILEAVQAVTQE
jgi:hypothetical protein